MIFQSCHLNICLEYRRLVTFIEVPQMMQGEFSVIFPVFCRHEDKNELILYSEGAVQRFSTKQVSKFLQNL